jgi:hypothetical protein
MARNSEGREVTPKPGEMHEVDQAFYKLTVQQRDAAWREVERLKKHLAGSNQSIESLVKYAQESDDEAARLRLLIPDLVKQAECDCVYVEISSAACQKCGRHATISHAEAMGKMIELTNLDHLLKEHIEQLREFDTRSSDRDEATELDRIRYEAKRIAREHSARLREE